MSNVKKKRIRIGCGGVKVRCVILTLVVGSLRIDADMLIDPKRNYSPRFLSYRGVSGQM
jgi:hypothetical protein